MENMINILEDFFVSNEFNITTQPMMELKNTIMHWISFGMTGGIIYGRPRIGKTRAIFYIVTALKAKYGREIPVYIYNATEHTSKDKLFYSELLKAIGHPEYDRGSVTALKDRLLNALIASACGTKHKKIVLFIDEAYNFNEKDYKWLMDIYNNLNMLDIHLSVFLVGSEEILARKQALIMAKQHQIVGRFMVEEFLFHGITSSKDMLVCLCNYDQGMNIENRQIILTKEFFSDAFNDGKRLAHCSEILMEEFVKIMKEIGIPTSSEIPMLYFINTITYCLKYYGNSGKKAYFPDSDIWNDSIHHSGYVESERVYYNV